jgi:hypothetical protein
MDKLVFAGPNTTEHFCQWLFSGENEGVTVIAHNFKGYDSLPILGYLYQNGVKPTIIHSVGILVDMGSCHLAYIQNRKRCKSVSSVCRCNPRVACNTGVQMDNNLIIVGRFTIKLKIIGYIVMIVDDISKDQHALISIRRRRHWETQHIRLVSLLTWDHVILRTFKIEKDVNLFLLSVVVIHR